MEDDPVPLMALCPALLRREAVRGYELRRGVEEVYGNLEPKQSCRTTPWMCKGLKRVALHKHKQAAWIIACSVAPLSFMLALCFVAPGVNEDTGQIASR